MAEIIKRLDQQRHELKALRFLLEYMPRSLADTTTIPDPDDFQIPDHRRMFVALREARDKADAYARLRALALEETDIDSFLALGGEYYHTYPGLVRERGKRFREQAVVLVT